MPKAGPDGIVLRLHSLMTLRGRVVDAEGKPIQGVHFYQWSPSDSDAQGRFSIRTTREEWNQRDKYRISLYASKYRGLDVPLAKFSLDRDSVFTLKPAQLIHGQVLDEKGKPLEDCKVELKSESEHVRSDFYEIPGPYKEGKWEESIGEYDQTFTVRVSVAGSVRSLKQYALEEVARGPIITRLSEGHRLTGSLVAKVALDEKNTPAIVLTSPQNEELSQQAKVQPGGSFAFAGLADGQYTLRLFPATHLEHREGSFGGVGAFSRFGSERSNKPWEKSITVTGRDVQLDPINLHSAGLLPGRLTGVAYTLAAGSKPLANDFGYICSGENTRDTVGGFYYLVKSMTDAEGRFRVDNCPPGKYVLRFSQYASGAGASTPSVWIRVAPEKTLDLRLGEPSHRLGIRFVVGDGSSRDAHAAAGLDAKVVALYTDPTTGEIRYIQDEDERLRAQASEITCELVPLDETITHWPIYRERFQFSPGILLKADSPHILIPNVSPGRWRLKLSAHYNAAYPSDENDFLTRDFAFTERMAPLRIDLPPASLAGTLDNPVAGPLASAADNPDAEPLVYTSDSSAPGPWTPTTIEAIPQDPGLPTRTCRGQAAFRFIGLAPGRYTVRVKAEGVETKRLDNVIVEKGKTTWLDKIVLKRVDASRP